MDMDIRQLTNGWFLIVMVRLTDFLLTATKVWGIKLTCPEGPSTLLMLDPIQDQGNDWKVPYKEFRFWGPKNTGGFSTIPFNSIHRDRRAVGAQGGRIEDP